jgi:hypothetical protein
MGKKVKCRSMRKQKRRVMKSRHSMRKLKGCIKKPRHTIRKLKGCCVKKSIRSMRRKQSKSVKT